MTLDLLDRAFLEHFAHDPAPPVTTVRPESITTSVPAPAPDSPPLPAASLLDRLMAAVPQEWHRLTERIEEAHAAGCHVIAVTGSHPGEGRTTLARGLVRTLADRGHRVALVGKPPMVIPESEDGAGPADVVVVDAGVWFPNGSFQRQLLARLAFGCDAAILVRHADRGTCDAHAEALAAIGLRVIGEVTTFGRPIPAGDPESSRG